MPLSIRRKVREASREVLDDEDQSASEQLTDTQAVAPADTSDEEDAEDQQDSSISLDAFSAEEDTSGAEEESDPISLNDFQESQEEQQAQESEAISLNDFQPPGGDGQQGAEPEAPQRESGITPEVLDTVRQQETGGVENPDQAVGDVGERGRFQIRPSTAVDPGLGVEPLAESKEEAKKKLQNPKTSREFTKKYLKSLEKEFNGSTRKALIAWQFGVGDAKEWIEKGADPSDLPDDVRQRVDQIVPTSQKAKENLKEGGVEEETAQDVTKEAQATAILPSGSPEEKVKAAQQQSGDFEWFDAWERGIGHAVRFAGEGLEFLERGTDYVESVTRSLTALSNEQPGEEQLPEEAQKESIVDKATPFDDLADFVHGYADSFDTSPSSLPQPDEPIDYIKPAQLNRVLGESIPTTVGIGAAFLTNPYVGLATAAAVEGGSYLEELDRADRRGADLSEGEKLGGAVLVGAANAALEKTGIDRILSAARAPGVKSKIIQTLASSAGEGLTETAQELTQVVGQNVQTENKPFELTERDVQRLAHGAYAGVATGFALGGAGAGIQAIQEKNRPDAAYVGTEFDENGNPVPQFRVTRPSMLDEEGKPPEDLRRVTRDELEQRGLQTPKHRAAMLADVWQEDLEDAGLDPERAEAVIQAQLTLLDQRAQKKGVELEQYLEENKVTPVRGGVITEESLKQFVGKKADMLQTERRALERAKELDQQGFDREMIRETTGWFRNPQDDMWRMEVPADGMDFKRDISSMEPTRGDPPMDLEQVVDTDHRIFELYPELKTLKVGVSNRKGGGFKETDSASDSVGMIELGNKGQWKKTFWHELQHAIQYVEGFARGASTHDEAVLREANSEFGPILDRKAALKEIQSKIAGFDKAKTLDDGNVFEVLSREDLEVLGIEESDILSVGESHADKTGNAAGIDRKNFIRTKATEELRDLGSKLRGLKRDFSQERRDAYKNVAGEIEARVAAMRNLVRRIGREPGQGDTPGATTSIPTTPESPIEGLEEESDEGTPTITRYYDNPVRSQIEREGKSPLLQDNENERAPAGAFKQTRDGRTLIELFENADESTIPHEISHLFRRTLTDSENAEIQEEMGIDEWSRQNEEEFARMFERWLFEGGEAPNAKMEEVFEQYGEWLENVYGEIQGSEIDVDVSDGVRSFFSGLLDQRVEPEGERLWFQKVADWFDIESRFARLGQGRVGREIKRRESFKEKEINQGTLLVQEVSRLVEGDREKMTDAILAAESDQRMESIEDQGVRDAAEKIRSYFEQKKTQYQKYGRLPMGFHERLANEIRSKKEDILSKENPSQEEIETLESLSKQLEKAQDLNFVHIPVDAWFRTLTEQKPEKLKRFLNLALEKERSTISIADLIEDEESPITREDLNLEDIVTSYSRQVGNDISMLRIREAAKREGAAVEGDHESLVRPPNEAVPFQGMSVNTALNSWLNSMVRNKQRSRLKEWINLSKMFAFWNPLFLPTYDILQGAMLGSTGPTGIAKGALDLLTGGVIDSHIGNAVRDVMDQSETFWEASNLGVSSQPFSSPIDETRKEMIRAYEKGKAQASLGGGLGALVGRMKGDIEFIKDGPTTQSIAKQKADVAPEEAGRRTLLSGPFKDPSNPLSKTANIATRTGGSLYELSWDTSWFLDRTIRQATYRYLKDEKGFTPEEAAETAAKAHGDYASVPQETRDRLNTLFFTPTFKIAMGKFLSNGLRGSGEIITQNERNTSAQYAGAFVRTAGILTAFDAIMTSALGFERDEFGRAYCRPTDATRAPKELCISWSTPFNLFTKYSARVWEAFNEPTTFNPVISLFNSNRWELNPMWRVGLEIASNRSANGGPIYNELDPINEKLTKMVGYYAFETVRISKQLFGEEMGEKGKQAMAEDMGRLQSLILGFFTFPYIRENEAQRLQGEIQRLLNVAEQEVGLKRVQRMLRQGRDMEEIRTFIEGQDERQEVFQERLRQIYKKYQEQNMRSLHKTPEPPQQQSSGFSLDDLSAPQGGQ